MSESRSKRKLVFSNEEKKKNTGGCVWSEEDEISVLKGMIDYEVLKQANPYADMGKFLDFIRPCLHFNVQRRQLTDKLWKLKNRFLNSNYLLSKPHHAILLELSKSINAWGGHASMKVDGDKCENVVDKDDQIGEEDDVVVDDFDKNGKVVTSGDEKDNVAVDDDVCVDKGLKVVKKKKKLVSRDDQNVEQEENVVLDDVKKKGKCSKVVSNKKKRKVFTCAGQYDKEDVVFVEDVDAGKGAQVVEDKNKGNIVTRDDQNVKEGNVVLHDVKKKGKCSKVVSNKKKRKVATCNGQNDKEDVVFVEDVDAGKDEQVVKDKIKWIVVTHDDQNVEEENVVLDDVKKKGKCSKVVKNKKKGKVVTCDGQNDKEDAVFVEDVDAGKGEQVVKDKNKGNVVSRDDQNVEEVNAVVDVVQSAKKNSKWDKVLGNENVPREVNRKDLKDFTSMYPELTNMLELETLSTMPQQIKKKCVIDTINFMGREKANELEEKLADFRLMEMELKAKKLDLASKHINLILEATHRHEAELQQAANQPLLDDD